MVIMLYRLGFDEQKESRVSKAALGHFKKADHLLKKISRISADLLKFLWRYY